MPTYEYACTECGDQTEVVQKFTDDPLTVCSTCGGRLRKVFSPVGIVFKGSGFYRNDSRAASKDLVGAAQKANGAEAGTKSSGDSSSAEPTAGKAAASGNGSSAGGGSGPGAGASPGSRTASGNGASSRGKPASAKVA